MVQQSVDETLEALVAEVDEKLDATEPPEWGEEVELAEGERFIGRYLDEAVSPETNRPVFLLLAPDAGEPPTKAKTPCFIRERTVLRSEFDRARAASGDLIVIARGEDREGKENTYHNYAVASAPCSEPLPQPTTGEADSDIPF
jgi:hypothetical protein